MIYTFKDRWSCMARKTMIKAAEIGMKHIPSKPEEIKKRVWS
jgi:hypothetical protein